MLFSLFITFKINVIQTSTIRVMFLCSFLSQMPKIDKEYVEMVKENTFGPKFASKRVTLIGDGKVKRRAMISLHYDKKRPTQIIQYYISNASYRSIGGLWHDKKNNKWIPIITKGPAQVELVSHHDGLIVTIKYGSAKGIADICGYLEKKI